jgi:protein involved in polysaccharide export with SLBB domain
MRRRPPPRVVAALALAGTVSGTLAWRDLNRRSDSQIRGSRRFWRVLIAMNPGNSVLYWLFGRR